MAKLPYIAYTEKMVGSGHPVLPDTLNRGLRELLRNAGVDPDSVNISVPSFSKTVNAGSNAFTGTAEARITAANALAVTLGWTATYVPYKAWDGLAMLPYNASLVTFNAAVAMIREGGDPTVIDVRAYGADVTGATNCTPSVVAAYAAPSATRTTVSWPDGIYLMNFPVAGVPLVTIAADNVKTVFSEGAMIKTIATASPTTSTIEALQYVFTASNRTGISFEGGTFDGNRSSSPDPMAAFFYGIQCSDVTIKNMTFQNSSNNYGGIIRGDAWNGSTGSMLKNWRIIGNSFLRSAWCTHLLNWWNGIEITDNYFQDLDLSSPTAGFSKLGNTAYSRAVRLTGYVNLTAGAAPIPIGNVTIRGNRCLNGTYFIEVWNQDAVNGRNPDFAENISIENNAGITLYGMGINSFRDSTIAGNTWKRLKLSAAQMATYAGTSVLADTSTAPGQGMECRPGYNMAITGNSIDGQWVSGESPDLTNSVEGITTGNNGFNVRCEVEVIGNAVRACYNGIDTQDTQVSYFASNRVTQCRRAFDFTSGGTNSFGRLGNVMLGNTFVGLAAQAAVNIVVIRGGWTVQANTISGDAAGFATAAPIIIPDTAAVVNLKGNLITNFLGAGIADQGLDSTYDDNTFDSKGSTSNGSIDFYRQNNKIVRIGRHTAIRCSAFFGWAQAAAAGESYKCGEVWCDAIPGSGQNRAIGGGTIFDMPVEVSGAPSNAAPVAGAWSVGTRIWRSTPVAAATPGDVCTTSGTPGTWKTMAVLSA